jgi:hypothetical protein
MDIVEEGWDELNQDREKPERGSSLSRPRLLMGYERKYPIYPDPDIVHWSNVLLSVNQNIRSLVLLRFGDCRAARAAATDNKEMLITFPE